MNVEQIARLASYQANAIRQAGTLGPAIPIAVIRAWVNDANIEAEKLLRRTREDYFLRVMNSATDTTAQKIDGIDYTPSTSLNLAVNTNRFSLPPDFLALKSIQCVTSGYEGMRFESLDISHPEFRSAMFSSRITSKDPAGGVFYDIVGDRTLWITPALNTAVDIEISYIARTKPLHYYATGTLTVTDATTAVTGSGTVWSSGSPFDASYLDLATGTSASATVPTIEPNQIYDGGSLHRVASITTDTALVLASNKVGTLAAGTGYYLASIPVIPRDAHFALADWVTAAILEARGAERRAQAFMQRFANRLGAIATSAARRNQADTEVTEEFDPGEW